MFQKLFAEMGRRSEAEPAADFAGRQAGLREHCFGAIKADSLDLFFRRAAQPGLKAAFEDAARKARVVRQFVDVHAVAGMLADEAHRLDDLVVADGRQVG